MEDLKDIILEILKSFDKWVEDTSKEQEITSDDIKVLIMRYLRKEPSRHMEEIKEVINCDADAETKCKMISNILTAKPHYFEEPKYCDRNICVSNEYNGIGCDECEVTKSQKIKTGQFAKWVANEIFDENWEDNAEAFAEIACRKLEKLGLVRANGNEWELIESQESDE